MIYAVYQYMQMRVGDQRISKLRISFGMPPKCTLPPALQNAAPDGPSAYIIGDVMDRSLRWTEGGSAAFLHRCLGLSQAIL